MDRDKRLILIRSDRVPEELWMEIRDIVQEAVIKTIPQKRNAKRQMVYGKKIASGNLLYGSGS